MAMLDYLDSHGTNSETMRSPLPEERTPSAEWKDLVKHSLTGSVTFKILLVPTETDTASPGDDMTPKEVLNSDRVKAKFELLATNWKNETAHQSSIRRMKDNFHYRKIVELGDEVIPMILEDLEHGDEPAFWYPALKEIAGGDDPVSLEHRGNVHEMTRAWVRWARENQIV